MAAVFKSKCLSHINIDKYRQGRMPSLINHWTVVIKLNLSRNSCPLILGLAWLTTTLDGFFFTPLFPFISKRDAHQSVFCKKKKNTSYPDLHRSHTTAYGIRNRQNDTYLSDFIFRVELEGLSSPGVTETGAGTISRIGTFTTPSGTSATRKRTSQTKRGDLTVVRWVNRELIRMHRRCHRYMFFSVCRWLKRRWCYRANFTLEFYHDKKSFCEFKVP